MDDDEAYTAALKLIRETSLQLQAVLDEYPREIYHAVLADLLAVWLARHSRQAREALLQQHLEHVRKLIDINETIIFGENGHPKNGDSRQ